MVGNQFFYLIYKITVNLYVILKIKPLEVLKLFTSNVICNEQRTQNSHLTRKDYVDSQISNGGNFLKADGSIPLTGNLDAGNKQITNLGYNISNPSDSC